MKMSDYTWNWWFVLNTIALIIGLMVGMVGNEGEMGIAEAICLCTMISFVPCLYIGMKPEKS
jgi:hypothetical protein